MITNMLRGGLGLLVLTSILSWAIPYLGAGSDPEIALRLGEPWLEMQRRSSAKIGPALPGRAWYQKPSSDASLRLVDRQYEFTTPPARFFTVSFMPDETVRSVRLSPQLEPLKLEETLKIILDLQMQWKEGGWQLVDGDTHPPFADTPEWRAWMRDPSNDSRVRWRAGDRYQVSLWAARTRDREHSAEERYLITMELAEP